MPQSRISREPSRAADSAIARGSVEAYDHGNRAARRLATSANRDMTHLFSTIGIAILMVGADMRIRRFTPEAQRILGLIPGDLGRPLANINPNVEIPNLQQMMHKVISSGEKMDTEVVDRHGSRYLLHLYPYQAADNKIEGAVMTLIVIPGTSKSK
jgi:two-component system, chemotaxis family, CheB/CheR fusion protein